MRDGDLSPQRDFFSNFAKATIGARPWGPFLFFFFYLEHWEDKGWLSKNVDSIMKPLLQFFFATPNFIQEYPRVT